MRRGCIKKWNREEMLSDELMAATIGNVDWLRLSLDKAKNRVAVDCQGYNTMHYAAQSGWLQGLRVLVEEYHMDMNMPDPRGICPLHLVLNKEHGSHADHCLKYLLDIGADPNVQTIDGQSPLHLAAKAGLLDCITMLVEAGANVMVRNKEEQRPLDLARIWGHRTCARYLADLMWKSNARVLLRETRKLHELKLVLLSEERQLRELEQERREQLSNELYTLWLERKGLPDTVRVAPSLYQPRSTPSQETLREPWETPSMDGKVRGLACRSKVTKPGTAEAPDCAAPAKGGVCWWHLLQPHDFGASYQLEVNRRGAELRPKVDGGATRPLPNLPLHILQRELFPASTSQRLKVPEGFAPLHIFDIPKKRPMPPGEWLELGVTLSSPTSTSPHSEGAPRSVTRPCSSPQGSTGSHRGLGPPPAVTPDCGAALRGGWVLQRPQVPAGRHPSPRGNSKRRNRSHRSFRHPPAESPACKDIHQQGPEPMWTPTNIDPSPWTSLEGAM
ncbi:ankyrin repeat domain-containing protein 53 [Narcine bancroftii]|uniref:ankyrin repeat domain-containing protein 53 n=1 Tax=Narcine bancroftii TaxID=1343680 RepID=UPI003831D95F